MNAQGTGIAALTAVMKRMEAIVTKYGGELKTNQEGTWLENWGTLPEAKARVLEEALETAQTAAETKEGAEQTVEAAELNLLLDAEFPE